MTDLTLYNEYSRKDVQQILEPGANFTPGAGVWGLQGVVNIRSKFERFVFFVTYGRQQSGHVFEEGISKNGVLSWQSQPSQTLEENRVKHWINQKKNDCKIFLFVRNDRKKPYIFLGDIKYLNHDRDREKPVWFQFQVENWRYLPQMHSFINPQVKMKKSAQLKTGSVELANQDRLKSYPVRNEVMSPKRAYFNRSFTLKWNSSINQSVRKGELLFSLVDRNEIVEIRAEKNCRLLNQLLPEGSYISESELPIAVVANVYLGMPTTTNKKVISSSKKSLEEMNQEPTVEIRDCGTDQSVTNRLKELLEAHPELLGTEDGKDLEFSYETTFGTTIPLVVHAPGKEKYVISLTDQEHDAETRREVAQVIKFSVDLAIDLEKPLETNDFKKILFLNAGTHPVTEELAKKYSVILVKL